MVNGWSQWPRFAVLVAATLTVTSPAAAVGPPGAWRLTQQDPAAPLPQGQRITVADGDTVVVEGDARVRVVRRRPSFVRIVADAKGRFVVLLVEPLSAPNATPTRRSDTTYEFQLVTREWPLAPRWEGTGWIEEHFSIDRGMVTAALGVDTPDGTILFANPGQLDKATEAAAKVIVPYVGFGKGGGGNLPFDQDEARAIAQATRNAELQVSRYLPPAGPNGAGPTFSTGDIAPPPEAALASSGDAPRAIGNYAIGLRPRVRKVHNVDPVKPAAAQSAGAAGIVILEITVGRDGTVTNARVLRSIPLLDQAALDAVRQWRYEPFIVDGQAQPIILTVTVQF